MRSRNSATTYSPVSSSKNDSKNRQTDRNSDNSSRQINFSMDPRTIPDSAAARSNKNIPSSSSSSSSVAFSNHVYSIDSIEPSTTDMDVGTGDSMRNYTYSSSSEAVNPAVFSFSWQHNRGNISANDDSATTAAGSPFTVSVVPLRDSSTGRSRSRRSPRRPDTPIPLLDMSDLADILDKTAASASSASTSSPSKWEESESSPPALHSPSPKTRYRPLRRYFHRNRVAQLPYDRSIDDSDDSISGDEAYSSHSHSQPPSNTPTRQYINPFDTMQFLLDALPDLRNSPTSEEAQVRASNAAAQVSGSGLGNITARASSEPDLLRLLASYTEELLAGQQSNPMSVALPPVPSFHMQRSSSGEIPSSFRRNRRNGISVTRSALCKTPKSLLHNKRHH
jgi:hypothetical protein